MPLDSKVIEFLRGALHSEQFIRIHLHYAMLPLLYFFITISVVKSRLNNPSQELTGLIIILILLVIKKFAHQ